MESFIERESKKGSLNEEMHEIEKTKQFNGKKSFLKKSVVVEDEEHEMHYQ